MVEVLIGLENTLVAIYDRRSASVAAGHLDAVQGARHADRAAVDVSGRGPVAKGASPATSDQLYIRGIRGHSREPLTCGNAGLGVVGYELALGNRPNRTVELANDNSREQWPAGSRAVGSTVRAATRRLTSRGARTRLPAKRAGCSSPGSGGGANANDMRRTRWRLTSHPAEPRVPSLSPYDHTCQR
jgi:hypothetical protein